MLEYDIIIEKTSIDFFTLNYNVFNVQTIQQIPKFETCSSNRDRCRPKRN